MADQIQNIPVNQAEDRMQQQQILPAKRNRPNSPIRVSTRQKSAQERLRKDGEDAPDDKLSKWPIYNPPLHTYTGEVAIIYDRAQKQTTKVLLGQNVTYESEKTCIGDNPFTDHFKEKHVDLKDVAEGIRLVRLAREDKKCSVSLCSHKFSNKAVAEIKAASAPSELKTENETEMDISESESENETEEQTQVNVYPHQAGLGQGAICSDETDLAFIQPTSETFRNWNNDEKSYQLVKLFRCHWFPLSIPVKDGKKVNWSLLNEGANLLVAVPEKIRNKVDSILKEINEDPGQDVTKYEYKPDEDPCLRNLTSEDKSCNEAKVKKRVTWRKMLHKHLKEEAEKVQNKVDLYWASKEKEEESADVIKYHHYTGTFTDWNNPSSQKKFMQDMQSKGAAIVSANVLQTEFQTSQDKINFFLPYLPCDKDSFKEHLKKINGTLEMLKNTCVGVGIEQVKHSDKCADTCKHRSALTVACRRTNSKINLKDAITKVWEENLENIKCGQWITFFSNFSVAREAFSGLYRMIAQLPPALSLNDPSADLLLWTVGHVDGINSVQAYIKGSHRYTSAHQENGLLISVNQNLGPSDCLWVCVDEKDQGQLDKLLAEHEISRTSKPFQLTEEILVKHKIPYYILTQSSGDLVVMSPGTWHYVISQGPTANIAWNIAPPHFASFAAMLRSVRVNRFHRTDSVVPVVSMLLHLARHYLDSGRSDLLISNLLQVPDDAASLLGQTAKSANQTKISRKSAALCYLFLIDELEKEKRTFEAFCGTSVCTKHEISTEKHYSFKSEKCVECKTTLWNSRIYFGSSLIPNSLCFSCALFACPENGSLPENGAKLDYNFSLEEIKRFVKVFFDLATGAMVLQEVQEGGLDGQANQGIKAVVKMFQNEEVQQFKVNQEREDQYKKEVAAELAKIVNPSGCFLGDLPDEGDSSEEGDGPVTKSMNNLRKKYLENGFAKTV